MALFGKKKKNLPPQEEMDDDFSIMEDDDEVFSSAVGTEPGLDDGYEEDDNDEFDSTPGKGADRKPNKGGGKGKFIVIVIVAILAAVAVMKFAGVLDNIEMPTISSSADSSGEGDETSGDVDFGEGVVVNEVVGESYSGSDNGNPVNGTGAIMAFTHAYYMQRDGDKAIAVYNPEATSYDGEFVQNNIDNRVPEGTKYKVTITPQIIGEQYDVVLSITPPGASSSKSINMSFETMEQNGKFYVKTFQSNGNFN